MARRAIQTDLALVVAPGPTAMHQRIAEAVRSAIASGQLHRGDALPSSRALATSLGVGRHSVVQAYEHLAIAGYVSATPGGATRVEIDSLAAAQARTETSPPRPAVSEPDRDEAPVRWDMRPGQVDHDLIDERDWRRAWRSVTRVATAHADDQSRTRLRHALAEHLRAARGIVVAPSGIFIVPGTGAGLRTIARAADLQGRTIAFEAPGYLEAAQTLTEMGVHVVGVPVDAHGVEVDDIPPEASSVYVTPAHQFPLGGRASAERRARLLVWAGDHDGLVIEDDYDGEFRYDSTPLPALAATTAGRSHVAYLGTASKCLSPSLRIAWLVPPTAMADRVRATLGHRPESVSSIDAAFLASFLESGAMGRHLARVRRAYAKRRQALTHSLAAQLPTLPRHGDRAGLHLTLELPPGVRADTVQHVAHSTGLRMGTLAESFSPGPLEGLILGYGNLPEDQAPDAVACVGRAIAVALAGYI